MSSLSRMLLVYDGTNEANAALARCASLSRALSATVDVVAIVDNVTANARSAGLLGELAHQRLAESAHRDLQRAVDTLTDDGIAARGYLRFGRTADAVAAHASTTRVDLIVVGYRAPPGSVAGGASLSFTSTWPSAFRVPRLSSSRPRRPSVGRIDARLNGRGKNHPLPVGGQAGLAPRGRNTGSPRCIARPVSAHVDGTRARLLHQICSAYRPEHESLHETLIMYDDRRSITAILAGGSVRARASSSSH